MSFLEQVITEFESLEVNNEFYILGDCNINLQFKGNCILDKTHKFKNHFKDFLSEITKCNESCSIYRFKQLINWPTRITGNTPTLHRITSPSLVLLILLYHITM